MLNVLLQMFIIVIVRLYGSWIYRWRNRIVSSTLLSSGVTIVDSHSFNIVCINVIVVGTVIDTVVLVDDSEDSQWMAVSRTSLSLSLFPTLYLIPTTNYCTLFSLVRVSSLRVETFNVISQMSTRCILS